MESQGIQEEEPGRRAGFFFARESPGTEPPQRRPAMAWYKTLQSILGRFLSRSIAALSAISFLLPILSSSRRRVMVEEAAED